MSVFQSVEAHKLLALAMSDAPSMWSLYEELMESQNIPTEDVYNLFLDKFRKFEGGFIFKEVSFVTELQYKLPFGYKLAKRYWRKNILGYGKHADDNTCYIALLLKDHMNNTICNISTSHMSWDINVDHEAFFKKIEEYIYTVLDRRP